MTAPLQSLDDRAAHGLRRAGTAFRATYGSSLLHLVALLVSFAVALAAFKQVYDADSASWYRYAIWFVGAALFHDLVMFPVYAALDRGASRLSGRRRRMSPGTVNYVRVPALLSGLLLLVFGAAILQRGEVSFQIASGKDQDPFLGRWLVITAVLFAASGLAYALGRRRSSRTA